MRLIIANLDCEAAFAESAGVSRYHPSRDVAQRIAALGTLMAAFGRDGDVVWTPLPVDPARVAGPVAVTLHSGAIKSLPRPEAMLAWGETAEVATWRAAIRTGRRWPGNEHSVAAPHSAGHDGPHHAPGDAPTVVPDDATTDVTARLWALPADAEAAWRCNDRRFCVPIQEALGCRLPGSAVIDSLAGLRAHLATLDLDPDHGWVLKAPFSASGRLRVRRRGRDLDADIATRIERLLTRFGALCFEPWMERLLDLGCLGMIEDADTWRILPPHRLETDHAGVFRGIAVDPDASWLAPDERDAVARAANGAARALARAGYRGPFGIDGFVYRRAGERALQPMCEINARLSFGFVAHALAQRLGHAALRLCVGAAMPRPTTDQDTCIVPLLHPGPGDDVAAWAALSR
ncbi:MAG TPA: hypothetical protein VNM90_22270 [Haliangium sp.]|nr:hypothetical protein [Haliangium sp.]